ncbi:hypothetical protein NDU88_010337 [Pleurodeles waltl]|uniref:Uncharacterized protein n=1 Tax=Pleurodeles waltl TaxID=8319 RepID=A0AAV7PXM1_PLEWA|nr:hypothetical protein NDU88_010337 [Pleurodeles waltl]
MDASISPLTLETMSIRTDITGFHSRVIGLESRVETLETHMSTIQDRDQDLSYLRSKVTDLEDRSRRDNIRLLGIPENEEGTDVQTFLSSTTTGISTSTQSGPEAPGRSPETPADHCLPATSFPDPQDRSSCTNPRALSDGQARGPYNSRLL